MQNQGDAINANAREAALAGIKESTHVLRQIGFEFSRTAGGN